MHRPETKRESEVKILLINLGNRYNIRMIFKSKHNFRISLMKIGPKRDPQQTAQCGCECGRSYIGETADL
jgi:hypothetical protein